jgi:DNA-binding transcriptional regulator YiaG
MGKKRTSTTQAEIGKMLDTAPRSQVIAIGEMMLKTYMLEVAATKRVLDPKVVRELRTGIKLLKSQP